MPPIVCIVGKSNIGKTTLLENLIAELKKRGYTLATVKHDVHGFDVDQPGKDSWRFAQVGSDAVVISSPQKLALIQKVDHDYTPQELARIIGEDYDIILTEGYKRSQLPKIEVHRKEVSEELLCSPDDLVAVVTDEPLDLAVWQCSFDEIPRLADLIEETFILTREKEDVALFIDKTSIPLSLFVKQFVVGTLVGMVSTLKGVAKSPKSIDISIRIR